MSQLNFKPRLITRWCFGSDNTMVAVPRSPRSQMPPNAGVDGYRWPLDLTAAAKGWDVPPMVRLSRRIRISTTGGRRYRRRTSKIRPVTGVPAGTNDRG